MFHEVIKIKYGSLLGWGVLNKTTGEWEGMVHNIVKGEIDMTVCGLIFNMDRYKAVHFLPPVDDSFSYGAFIKKIDLGEMQWFIFIQPFEKSTWIYLTIYAAAFSTLAFFIFKLIKPVGLFGFIKDSILAIFQMIKGTILVFSSVFGNAPFTREKLKQGSKIFIFTICLVGNLSFLIYQASLTSYLTVDTHKLPFSSMKGLIDEGYQ